MESTSDHPALKITRRGLLVQGAALLACAAARPYGAFGQADAQDFVEVKTRYGGLRGARDRGVAVFKGVPYGGSVSGANRFKAAPPAKPWTGVRDALRLAAPSPQAGRAASEREPAPAEECLFLNVWTPGPSGRKRPVMFYSHGGGMRVSGPEAEKVAHNMSGMQSAFARTGHPAVAGQPAWPAYDVRTRATMEIKAECRVVNDPYGAERAMWEKLDA